MKYAILALFFAVNAKAGIPPASQPGATASTTGVDAGEDASLDDLTVKTITSTGTAPSATLNGAVIRSTGTVLGDLAVGGVITSSSTPVMRGASGIAHLRLDDSVGARLTYNTNFWNVGTSGVSTAGNLTAGGTKIDVDFFGLEVENGPVGLYSRTIAQLLAITPAQVGQTYFCSDCATAGAIVVSTGTGAGNFAISDGGPFD